MKFNVNFEMTGSGFCSGKSVSGNIEMDINTEEMMMLFTEHRQDCKALIAFLKDKESLNQIVTNVVDALTMGEEMVLEHKSKTLDKTMELRFRREDAIEARNIRRANEKASRKAAKKTASAE